MILLLFGVGFGCVVIAIVLVVVFGCHVLLCGWCWVVGGLWWLFVGCGLVNLFCFVVWVGFVLFEWVVEFGCFVFLVFVICVCLLVWGEFGDLVGLFGCLVVLWVIVILGNHLFYLRYCIEVSYLVLLFVLLFGGDC